MNVLLFALQMQGLVKGRSSCQNMCDGLRLHDAAASKFRAFR